MDLLVQCSIVFPLQTAQHWQPDKRYEGLVSGFFVAQCRLKCICATQVNAQHYQTYYRLQTCIYMRAAQGCMFTCRRKPVDRAVNEQTTEYYKARSIEGGTHLTPVHFDLL